MPVPRTEIYLDVFDYFFFAKLFSSSLPLVPRQNVTAPHLFVTVVWDESSGDT